MTDGTETIAAMAAAGLTAAAATGINMQAWVQNAVRTLATPEPLVYQQSSPMTPMDDSTPAADDNDCDRERPSSSTSFKDQPS